MNPEPADLDIIPSKPLPEDTAKQDSSALISSDVNFLTIIMRWQPMGYRIVINLPFVADDINPLFAIQNTPFIFPMAQRRVDTYTTSSWYYSTVYPMPSTLSSTSLAVTCTRYDAPPALAVAAAAYRFWRGSMMYRFRCVSNFVAAGYIMFTSAKSLVASQVVTPGNLTNTHRSIQGLDAGAKRFMGNGYIMSDVSMFRHAEMTMPFEYPVSFYDTHRFVEEAAAMAAGSTVVEVNCPDNFIVAFSRGGMTSPSEGAQVVFELEYAPGPDLEFSQELAFSRHLLEVNNYTITNDLTEPITAPILPLVYPLTL